MFLDEICISLTKCRLRTTYGTLKAKQKTLHIRKKANVLQRYPGSSVFMYIKYTLHIQSTKNNTCNNLIQLTIKILEAYYVQQQQCLMYSQSNTHELKKHQCMYIRCNVHVLVSLQASTSFLLKFVCDYKFLHLGAVYGAIHKTLLSFYMIIIIFI